MRLRFHKRLSYLLTSTGVAAACTLLYSSTLPHVPAIFLKTGSCVLSLYELIQLTKLAEIKGKNNQKKKKVKEK